MEYFDTHIHLDDERFNEDRAEVIQKMQNAGVTRCINMGCNIETSKKAIELSKEYDFIYSAVGIHPEELPQTEEELWKSIGKIEELAVSNKKTEAIGEIGLDYYWRNDNKELQKELTQAKEESARAKFATFLSKSEDIDGGKLFVSKVENFDGNAIKAGIEFMSQKLGECIIILASEKTVAVKVSDSFVKKGVNAGKIVGEIARATGANGGGRPNFAQGGVKDASKLDEILVKVQDDIKSVRV